MIHGISKYSSNGASKAVKYLMSSEFMTEAGEWAEREPPPTVLHGDPRDIEALCNGLTFKHTYTSGVLSFTAEESARFKEQPELLDQVIKEFQDFAFAGVKRDDCKPHLLVAHEHLGRLEVHYVIPRVSLESGKYFNPFPPNYDGKRGKGSNQKYLEQNDAFVDQVCAKFELQNPRDPNIARTIKIEKFDGEKITKSAVHKKICELIDRGGASNRNDIIDYLQKAGGTITRKGDDYLSVKFEGSKRAIRLKGEIYGSDSYDAIRSRVGDADRGKEAKISSIEEAYAGVLRERAQEYESRHSKKELGDQKSESLDSDAKSQFFAAAKDLQDIAATPGVLADSYGAVRDFAADNRIALSAPGTADAICSIESSAEVDNSIGIISTGNPVLDQLAHKFRALRKRLEQEAIEHAKTMWQVKTPSAGSANAVSKGVDLAINLLMTLFTGQNYLSPGRPVTGKELKAATAAAETQQGNAKSRFDADHAAERRLEAAEEAAAAATRPSITELLERARNADLPSAEKPKKPEYVPTWKRGIEDDDGPAPGR